MDEGKGMTRKTKRALMQGIRDRDQDAKDDLERLIAMTEERDMAQAELERTLRFLVFCNEMGLVPSMRVLQDFER